MKKSAAFLACSLLSLAAIGVGLGAFAHWGIGLAAVGLLAWLDLFLLSRSQ